MLEAADASSEHAGTDEQSTPERGWWWKSLVIGFALWLAAAAVTFATHDPVLMPMLILVGSFLVPSAAALFVIERARGNLTGWRIAGAFAISGVCGVLAAALIESRLVDDVWVYVRIGMVEELVKGGVILGVGWTVRPKSPSQGALLGAAVGAGFAAFESAGYAYGAALDSSGLGVVAVLQTEALRAVLTPLGHVLWSGILGAVLFASFARRPWWRATVPIVACYLGVAALHALWDSMAGISQIIAMLVTGDGWHFYRYASYFARSPHLAAAIAAANWIYPIGLALVAFIGVSALQLVAGPARVPAVSSRPEAEAPPSPRR